MSSSPSRDLYGVFGSGGFGREVVPMAVAMLRSQGVVDPLVAFVVREEEHPSTLNGHPVLSETAFFAYSAGRRFFTIAIADSRLRQKIAERAIAQGAEPFSLQAPHSMILDDVQAGPGLILCPFAIITSTVRIGRFFHANIHSYLAHDCVIGDYVTFAPKVQCNGNVIIGDHAFIGAGALLRHGTPDHPLIIGAGAVVGMGAVVVRDVAPLTTVVGNPARVLRTA